MNKKIIPIAQVKADKARKAHATLTLAAWDKMEHADKRQRLEKKAEVERAARQRL